MYKSRPKKETGVKARKPSANSSKCSIANQLKGIIPASLFEASEARTRPDKKNTSSGEVQRETQQLNMILWSALENATNSAMFLSVILPTQHNNKKPLAAMIKISLRPGIDPVTKDRAYMPNKLREHARSSGVRRPLRSKRPCHSTTSRQ